MKTIGFPISKKENEFRRALIPTDLDKIKNVDYLFFEKGYGDAIGYSDADYIKYGAHVQNRDDILKKDIICDPKIGDADYLSCLKNQTVFGWVHAVQNRDITDSLVDGKLTAYAWEDMFISNRHVFWRNNEIAGEAAVLHAFQCYGAMPYNSKVAILGRGNIANGALKILTLLGADVCTYNRKTEKLFRNELSNYDVVVNAILWDVSRSDHIIYRSDLKRMKKGAMIIDVSCDKAGGVESSIPTTIENPTYICDGVLHYVVDHTPSLFYKTATTGISQAIVPFIDQLCEDDISECLLDAKCIEKGVILDRRIIEFQQRM